MNIGVDDRERLTEYVCRTGRPPRRDRVLIFDVPAHAGNFFKRVDREVNELPRELPKVLSLGRETGIHFLEPA